MIRLVIDLIPIIIIISILKIKKIKVDKKIDIAFYGILSVFLAIFISNFLGKIFPLLSIKLSSKDNFLFRLCILFISAGVVEEGIKFISILITKPSTKKEIFINTLFIALIFETLENILFASASSFINVIERVMTQGHMIFGIIMSYYLIKAFENKDNKKQKKYYFLSCIIPMVFHGLYDAIVINQKFKIYAIILGISTYLILIYILCFKFKYREEEEEKNNNKVKIKFKIIKILFIIFSIFFFTFSNISKKEIALLNVSINICDDIYVEVLQSEKVKIDNIFTKETNFIKVKIKIINNSNKVLDEFNISKELIYKKEKDEKIRCELLIVEDDALSYEIKPNTVEEGYVYFKTDKEIEDYYLKISYRELNEEIRNQLFKISK